MQQHRYRSNSPDCPQLVTVHPKMASNRRRRDDMLICTTQKEGGVEGEKEQRNACPSKKIGVLKNEVKKVSGNVSARSIATQVIVEEEEVGDCSHDGSASTDPSTTSSYQELTVTTITPKEDKTKLGLYLRNKELETENTRLFSVVLECVQEMERMEANLQKSKSSANNTGDAERNNKNDSNKESKLLQTKLLSLIEAKHDNIQSSKEKEESNDTEEVEKLRADLDEALARQKELESELKDYKKVAKAASTKSEEFNASPNSKKHKASRLSKSSVLPSVVPDIVEARVPPARIHPQHHSNDTVESLRAETELTIVASNLQRQLEDKTAEVELTFNLVQEKEKKMITMEYELERVKTDLAWSERRRKELNALLEIKEEMTSMGCSNNTSSLSFSPVVKSALRKMPSKDFADTTTVGDDNDSSRESELEEEEAVKEKIQLRRAVPTLPVPTKSALKRTNDTNKIATAPRPPKPVPRYQLTHKFFNFPNPYEEQGPGSVVGLVITTRKQEPPSEPAAKSTGEEESPADDLQEGEKVRAAILNSAAFEKEIAKFYQDEIPSFEDNFEAKFD